MCGRFPALLHLPHHPDTPLRDCACIASVSKRAEVLRLCSSFALSAASACGSRASSQRERLIVLKRHCDQIGEPRSVQQACGDAPRKAVAGAWSGPAAPPTARRWRSNARCRAAYPERDRPDAGAPDDRRARVRAQRTRAGPHRSPAGPLRAADFARPKDDAREATARFLDLREKPHPDVEDRRRKFVDIVERANTNPSSGRPASARVGVRSAIARV